MDKVRQQDGKVPVKLNGIGKRRRRSGSARPLLYLILFLLLAAGWSCAVFGGNEIQARNSSGSQNSRLSVDPIRKSEGYATVLYDIHNGLPTSEANAIAQTSDGFLWIGSYAGLIRYDGNTFERIDSRTGITSVRCLYVDSLERLWIGTNDSGVFLMSRDGIQKWDKQNGLDSVSIRVVIEDDDGLIYIGSTSGIAMIDAGMKLTVLADERIAGQSIKDCRHGSDGLIYGLTQAGDLFTMKDGRLVTFLGHEECRVQGILAMIPDPRRPGDLYLGTKESRLYRGSLEDNFASLGMQDIAPLSETDRLENINGDIWICAANGIGRLDALGFHRLKNVPMDNSVGHVMTDYEGNLWFTSNRQGIMKIVPNQFSDLFERYGLPQSVVNSTCMYGKQLFIGTDTGLIVVEDRERVESIPLTEAATASGKKLRIRDLLTFLDGVRIRSIIRDSNGRLWISTWRRHGLLCYEQGKLLTFSERDGLFSDQIRTVSECGDGSILVANSGGVSVIRDNLVTGGYGEEEGINNREILTVTEGFHHEIILGTDGGGIYVIEGGKTRHIGLEEGLSSEVIMRVKRSSRQDIYWIVTSNSLAFMTSDFEVTTIEQFPYPNNYDLYEDNRGNAWVLSSSGIYVVSEKALLANGEIDPIFYGSSSGLPYVATANSYSEQTAAGDLYIAGSQGVVKINMDKPLENMSELKVSLPYIDADGTRYYPDSQGSFALPGLIRRMTIYPYVFNYSLIDPQVSYYLEGFDTEDTTVSCSNLTPLDYTNLQLGAFHFILTVKDPVGLSDKTISFQIIIGKEMTTGDAGTIIMIYTSLLLIAGILIYISPYQNLEKLEDRLMAVLILVNIVLDVGELVAYYLEYLKFPLARELIIAGNTIYYISYVFFAYLLWVYLDYRCTPDKSMVRKRKLLSGIPCFFFSAGMILNIKTGWAFTINGRNGIQLHAIMSLLPIAIVSFYLIFAHIKVYRTDKNMAIVGALLLTAHLTGEICFRYIASTSLFYTLMIVCIHLHLMYRPMKEVAI